MKLEQFKTAYLQIQLNKEQKNKIWQQIETVSSIEKNDKIERNNCIEKKKVFLKGSQFSTRAAICASVLLLSGLTVLAAGELSVPDRIAEAIRLFTNQKQLPSDEEKTLYTQYGNALNQEITLEHGTLKLDAALYDNNFLLIPFRYFFQSNIEESENTTSDADFSDTNTYFLKKQQCQNDLNHIKYSIGKDAKINNGINCSYTIINPQMQNDGIFTGSIVLKADTKTSFQESEVLQLLREVEQPQVLGKIRWLEEGENTESLDVYKDSETGYFVFTEDYTIPHDVLTTFQLGKALEQRTLSIHESQSKTLDQMQISIDSITLSPISLYCNLRAKNVPLLSIDVVLKDNSMVTLSPNGSGCSFDNIEEGYIFTASQFFDKPISLDNAAGVWIRKDNLEVWLPLEN